MQIISGDDCFRVLDKPEYIFFYFTASWCGPCQRILPDLNTLIHKLEEFPIEFYKIDIDDSDNDEICEKCQIKSVPSFLLFKDREFEGKVNGADIQAIVQMLTEKCEFITDK
jgi:thioredoxin 1|tara:strand:+ start:639 stop:974 length:336 start_codon:yes stop_codon:yes gene_type:complete